MQCPGAVPAPSSAPTLARTARTAAAKQTDDLNLMGKLIECNAAAPLRIEFVVAVRPEEKIVVVEAEDHAEAAELSALDDPPHFPDIRIECVSVPDDQMHARSVGGGHDGVALFERQSQWLFDQHMLALLHGFDRLRCMESVRRRDVDRLD